MTVLSEGDLQLLERLGAEGKATELKSDEISAAKVLERADLVFIVPDGAGRAVITPRGRRHLAELERKPKHGAPPFRYT
jgi:hypothetical protein